MCCRIRPTSPTNGCGEFAPEMWELFHKDVLRLPSRPKSCDPSVLWRSATVQRMRHNKSCCRKACKSSSLGTSLPRTSTCQLCNLLLVIISCDLGDHAQLLFLSKLPPEHDANWSTNQTSLQHSMDSEVSLSALCCRSSRYLAMILPSLLDAFPRLRAQSQFRDGYTRCGQQLDGCRGTRAVLRRVEYPSQG